MSDSYDQVLVSIDDAADLLSVSKSTAGESLRYRFILAFVVSFALATAASASPYSEAVLADAPLAYWRLGDAGPTTVADLTSNGHTGTADAGVSFGQPSLAPGDASDASITLTNTQRVTVPGFEKFGVGATGYSVEFWVVLNEPPSGFTNLVGDGESQGDYFLMAYVQSSGRIRAHALGAAPTALDSIGSLTVGTARHVVTSWDQATGVASIYLDGELDSSAFIGNGTPTNTNNAIYLGDDDREVGVGLTLDEVAIYDYALSPATVGLHFALALPEPSSHMLAAAALLVICTLRALSEVRGWVGSTAFSGDVNAQ